MPCSAPAQHGAAGELGAIVGDDHRRLATDRQPAIPAPLVVRDRLADPGLTAQLRKLCAHTVQPQHLEDLFIRKSFPVIVPSSERLNLTTREISEEQVIGHQV